MDEEQEAPERIEQHQRRLPVKLTQEERSQRGVALAMLAQELSTAREERKSLVAQAKAKEQEIIARMDGLAAVVREGTEIREVWCYGTADLRNGRITFFREDTGEKVGDRAIKAEERQMSIPGAGKPVAEVVPFNPPHLAATQDDDVPPAQLPVEDYADGQQGGETAPAEDGPEDEQ